MYIAWKKNPEFPQALSNPFDFLDRSPSQFIAESFDTLLISNFIIDKIKDLREEIKSFFMEKNTNDQLQEKFFEKFDEFFYGPMFAVLGVENTKNWLLDYEKYSTKARATADGQDLIHAKATAIRNINSAFSNHEQDSDERKIESLITLYYNYENSNDVPKIIKEYIYFSAEELLKKNPDRREKVKELQNAHAEKVPEADLIESEQEIQSMDDDKA
jgi:hypothetical protein